jgi:hypothetical protein
VNRLYLPTNSSPELINEKYPKIISDFVQTVVRKMLLHLNVEDDAWEQLEESKDDKLQEILDEFAREIGTYISTAPMIFIRVKDRE